jgi:hypothetical protein
MNMPVISASRFKSNISDTNIDLRNSYYQEEGKPAQLLKVGDVFVTHDGVKHWHGATKDRWFVHLGASAGMIISHEARCIKDSGSAIIGYHARLSK